jgi:hypothetical protein
MLQIVNIGYQVRYLDFNFMLGRSSRSGMAALTGT